jgi:hypothetical protein
MNDERCKELMNQVGMPNSTSLMLALKQVANETEQECLARNGWTNVDDQMPTINGRYLVMVFNPHQPDNGLWTECTDLIAGVWAGMFHSKVVLWAEIPPAPRFEGKS